MDAPQEDHTRHSRDSSSADSADGLLQSAAPLPGADDDVEAAVVGSSHSSGGGWGLGGSLPALLPSLPQPKVEVMKQESARGCLLVLLVITVCLAATHGGATLLRSENLSTAFLITIYIEAGLALGCLVGLMYGDPGVVQRTPQTALPVPQKVRVLLERTPPQYPCGNITDGQLGTYCVRCYLWRDSQPGRPDCASRYLGQRIALCAPVPKRSHHCSTCQRCVVDFDHHCGVFGRCIAGQGFAGNMGFFKLIITCGSWGSITATSCVVIGWTEQMGWSGFVWAVGGLIGLLLLWQVCGCVLRLHFQGQRMEAAKRRQQAERSRMPPQAEVEVSTAGARRSMAAEVSAGTQ